MRLLHTADWHLGQRLLDFDRKDEHEIVLNWMLDTVSRQQVDVLLIAGDVFDSANPPNYALALYYQFLRKLLGTCCQQVVVIGGNHDSPALLNAPSDLLKGLNIHIVGGVSKNMRGEVDYAASVLPLVIDGKVGALVAAVPFLRNRDLKFSVPEETASAHAEAIRCAIKAHYQSIADLKIIRDEKHLPLIATGHLYVQGGVLSDSEQEIYLGNLGRVGAEVFPDCFDYVALGHLHRPQIVHKQARIRYAGSPIPLSFSEYKDEKQVNIVSFKDGALESVTPLAVPLPRKLRRMRGTLEEIEQKICAVPPKDKSAHALNDWVEVLVSDPNIPNVRIEEKIRQLAEEHKDLSVLKIRIEKTLSPASADFAEISLDALTPKEVFLKKCAFAEMGEAQTERLARAFSELLDEMSQAPE